MKVTKGVILAGGTGSRLRPLTRAHNKHMLPVADELMISYPVKTMADAGITDIMVVLGGMHCEVAVTHLGDGSDYGVNIVYSFQKEPKGISDALRRAKAFVNTDPSLVILGDNIFEDSFKDKIKAHPDNVAGIFLKSVDNLSDYGVARVKLGTVEHIVEKPKKQECNDVTDFAVTGAYLYPADVFDAIETLKPSGRGELEVTDLNVFYLKQKRLQAAFLQKRWFDCGASIQQYQQVNDSLIQDRLKI